jgi:prolyl oligopeptidase
MTSRHAGASLIPAILLGLLVPFWTQGSNDTPAQRPVAPVRPVTDDYYGTQVVDNYRYMENVKDPEVQSWFKQEDGYTRATLAGIPGREKLLARLRDLVQSDPALVRSVRRCPGDLYFYKELRAGDKVAKLYVRHGLEGDERLLVDPATIAVAPSNQGKGQNAITDISLSEDCRHVAVSITPGDRNSIPKTI